MPQPHNYLFFGTPTVASETLATLLARGLAPALVVTAPDAPAGRGLVLTPSPVKTLAESHGIPVLTPQMLTVEVVTDLGGRGLDYAVVVAYGKIFPEELIRAFPKGVVNVHYSLLPRHRGATPLEAALLAGDEETGVTIQQMVKELDAGDILAEVATTISPIETARELRPRLIQLGAELLAVTLPALEAGTLTRTPQDASLATRSGKLKKEDGLLNLSADAEENWRKYRAYADTIGTYFIENDKRMKVTLAEFARGEFRVLRVIPEGKRETDYRPR